MPRWPKVWAIARKEIRDILRDRRTLFMAVIFPLILYPLLIIGLIQATAIEATRAERKRAVVAISGGGNAPGLLARLSEAKRLRLAEFDGEGLPAEAGVGLVIPDDFKERLSSGGTASLEVRFDSANQASRDALGKVIEVVESFSRDVLAKRLESCELDETFVSPINLDETDVATPRQRGVFKLGKILAFLLVTFCMMGALYPALDAVSGEKERGTLETLLSIPATRMEILSGKYLAVFGMSVTSVVANFLSLSVTMLMVNSLMREAVKTDLPIDFSIPFAAIFLLVPALLPLAAFFSAVSLGIAAFARSTREGQYYLAPLYAAALPLTAVALVSSVELTYFTAFIPITSISLFLKDGLLGTLSPGPTVVAILTTCAYACVALMWAASVFSREDVLFGAPAAEGGGPPEARGMPKLSHAVFVWVISLILTFYVGGLIERRMGPIGIATSLAIYLGLVLGPVFVLAGIEKLDLARLFCVRAMRGRAAVSIFLFAPAALFLNVAAEALQQMFLKAPVAVSQVIRSQEVAKVSVVTLFLSVAFLPAICEELFYRGFIMRTIAVRKSARWAVIVSAAFFAAAHLNPYQALPLFALGIVLALAAQSSGTILVPMAVHFANNFITLLVYLGKINIHFEGRAKEIALLSALFAVGSALTFLACRVARPKGEK